MAVEQGSGAPTTPSSLARDHRKELSLQGWREIGTVNGAAGAAGVCRKTIMNWFRGDVAYKSAVQAAIEEYSAAAAQEIANGALEMARKAFRGDVVLTKRGIEGGKPVEIYEPVQLPAIARNLLTRGDPRFTHPKQEVEHSGAVTVSAAIAEARKRMETVNPPLEGKVEPEGALEAPGKAVSSPVAPFSPDTAVPVPPEAENG